MNVIIRIILLGLFLSLTACDSIYHTAYTYQPPSSERGKMCVAQCVETKKTCDNTRQVEDENCRLEARKIAYFKYQKYMQKQTVKGLPIEKRISDFDDSFYKCNHSFSCTRHFNTCYQHCGGKITKHKENI